ncbi:MAG: polysaccharide deacetylase family protein [Candidatus Competibacter sp.]|nr:polysaccharide deacetylase family protein [Candidatus Competibacter sp.]
MTDDRIRWPNDAPFALFLSHDIDQIHDRELFRILADLNHIRRLLTQGEAGHLGLASARVLRSLFKPKPTGDDVRTLLAIEARYGFPSTFFILHDPYWSRYGPRYRLGSPGLRRIVDMILAAGGEIGVHGGYYRFNQAAGYRESREAVGNTFGIEAVGIRNHYLRFSFPETWLAQEAAGFRYDATFGWTDRPGARDGRAFPFHPVDPRTGRTLDLTVLPLTVMDTTLFRHLRLGRTAALDTAWNAIAPIIAQGGLVSLLWHNNYFDEPEYQDWQWVYEALLERLAALGPWCATGAAIEEWGGKKF